MAEAKRDRTYVAPTDDAVFQILDHTLRTPVIEARDPMVTLVEPEQEPDNFLYNTLSDPKLNAGLANIAEAIPEVVLGTPSENSLVDLGVANVPGVGPAAILAAGGVPGILDVAGAGGAKKAILTGQAAAKKFLGDIFGVYSERGLASEIGKTIIENTSARTRDEVYAEARKLLGEFDISIPEGRTHDPSALSLSRIYNFVKKQAPIEDARVWNEAQRAVKEMEDAEILRQWSELETKRAEQARLAELRKRASEAAARAKDVSARKASRAQKKAGKTAVIEESTATPRFKATLRKKEEIPVNPATKVKASAVLKNSRPNDWEGNGWKSVNHELGENDTFRTSTGSKTYEDLFQAERPDERSKRAGYVLDSLMAHHANLIRPREGARLSGPGEFRRKKHEGTTYDNEMLALSEDIRRNLETGNLPDAPRIEYRDRNVSYTDYDDMRREKRANVIEPFVRYEDGAVESLYDLLFRGKSDKKVTNLIGRH